MLLELLQRLTLMTSLFATLAWCIYAPISANAIYMAGASLGLTLASLLLTPISQSRTALSPEELSTVSQSPSIATSVIKFIKDPKFWIALLSWAVAGTTVAYAVFEKKIGPIELGFFSPLAISVCWIGLIPLLLSRMSHRARCPKA